MRPLWALAPLQLLCLLSLHGVADAASLLLRGGRSRQAPPPPDVVADLNGDGKADVDMNADGVADVDMNGDGVPDEDLNGDGVPDSTGDGLMGFPLSPTQDPTLILTTTVLPTFAPQPGYTDKQGTEGVPNSDEADGNWRAQDKTALGTVPCNCANCSGRIYEGDTRPGAKGFQCKPNAYGMAGGSCMQVGDPEGWVVQTRADITYERFCLFTCKPLVPKRITLEIPCAPLSKYERQLEAQTPSGNGREFVFRANPMTEAVPWPAEEEVEEDTGPKDPVAQLVATFALYGGSKKDDPAPGGDELCDCECESEQDIQMKKMKDLIKWNAAVSPGALYPTPPPTMPPPPPPPLPHVVHPPLPPPPPPGPSAVGPLPPMPMAFPLPSLEAAPTYEPPVMPTWQPTPPPPAMPPPPEPREEEGGASPMSGASGVPAAPGFAAMQLQQQAPPVPPAYMAFGPEGVPSSYWGAAPPGAGAYAYPPPPMAFGAPGAAPSFPFAAAPVGLDTWGQSLLQEEHRPMRFTRPGGEAPPAPVRRAKCAAEKCSSRCSESKAERDRQAAMWEAERSALQKARLRSVRLPQEDDDDEA